MMTTFYGQFVWYELLTEDPGAAESFYRAVVGWGARSWSEDQSYTMWTVGEQPIGGLMPLPEPARQAGAPPHWLGYVGVADIQQTTRLAQSLGARMLVEPTFISGEGHFAVLQDPQGAGIALFMPQAEAPQIPDDIQVGQVSWHELMTTDMDAGWDFYHALFGWEKTEAMDLGEAGLYQMFGKDGRTLGGIVRQPTELQAPPAWLFYIKVNDLDKVLETVRANGGSILNGPMEVPGGDRVAQCQDPQGAVFALHSVSTVA